MKDVDIFLEDCVGGMGARLEAGSVDLCVTSIPFGQLFMYSGKTEDVGNNQDGVDMEEGAFGLHMRFFCEQLFRVMGPGRNACIHIQQLLAYKNQHGWMGRRDFRNAVIYLFKQAGFNWIGEVVIPKNPQAMAQRLSLHSLMFITGKRNSRDWAPAVNDYVMIFQKPGESKSKSKEQGAGSKEQEQEQELGGVCRALYDKEVNPFGWMTTEQWIRWACGVWDSIQETDVLDGYRSARESDEERHVCPLQLSVIFRLVSMYSAPGELVLDPFMGIGSSAYVCQRGWSHDGRLAKARRCVGFELKESYHALALRNLEKLEGELGQEGVGELFLQEGTEKIELFKRCAQCRYPMSCAKIGCWEEILK